MCQHRYIHTHMHMKVPSTLQRLICASFYIHRSSTYTDTHMHKTMHINLPVDMCQQRYIHTHRVTLPAPGKQARLRCANTDTHIHIKLPCLLQVRLKNHLRPTSVVFQILAPMLARAIEAYSWVHFMCNSDSDADVCAHTVHGIHNMFVPRLLFGFGAASACTFGFGRARFSRVIFSVGGMVNSAIIIPAIAEVRYMDIISAGNQLDILAGYRIAAGVVDGVICVCVKLRFRPSWLTDRLLVRSVPCRQLR
jgi:hypothetical protein